MAQAWPPFEASSRLQARIHTSMTRAADSSSNDNSDFSSTPGSRRAFLRSAGSALALGGLAPIAQGQKPNQQDAVQLSRIHALTEAPEKTPGPFEAQPQRVGYAVVGLGRLSLNQILPAFGKSKYSKPVALVSGDREKARKIAAQYGIREKALYDYTTYDQIASNPEVQVIYIVLPNNMHAEFVLRGANRRSTSCARSRWRPASPTVSG